MSDQIPKDAVIGSLVSRYNWKRIERPRPWHPKTEGEGLVGYYGGRTVRSGKFGQYDVALVHVPAVGSYTLTGVAIIQAIDTSGIRIGWPIRVVWKGFKELGTNPDGSEKKMKDYDVFVAEGEVISAEFLPKVVGLEPTDTQDAPH